MDYVPLYVSLFIIIGVGVILPFAINGITPIDELETDNAVLSPIINLFDDWEINLGFGTFSFRGLFGDTLTDYLIDYLKAFALIPEIILIPLMILITLSLTYTFIKILPTT